MARRDRREATTLARQAHAILVLRLGANHPSTQRTERIIKQITNQPPIA